MITDAAIREQGYIYFLAEAPELIQIIEQELFSLSEDYSIAKVHNLMRATHTLKGGAANVGLEVIKMIAHFLEDVFKALYNPKVEVDAELQTLLLQAYECLSIALNTELIGSTVNDEELLHRTTSVFAQLQEKLGDAFGDEAHIPTSEELGFDIVQSVFEVGVEQRLNSIAEAVNNPPNNDDFIELLHSQAEVFLGLAESLNLPGLGEISQTILLALQANPTQVQQIAEIALADLQQSQKLVLEGDRTSGGETSPALRKLTMVADNELSGEWQNNLSTDTFDEEQFYQFLTTSDNNKNESVKPITAKFYLKVIRYIFGWFNHERQIPEKDLHLDLLIPSLERDYLLDYIENWLKNFLDYIQDEEDSKSLYIYRNGIVLIILFAVTKFKYSIKKLDGYLAVIKILQNRIHLLAKEYKNYPPVTSKEINWLDSPRLQSLLAIKEIPQSVSSQTTDNLLEAIWGEEASQNLTEQVVTTPTEHSPEKLDLLTVKEQVAIDVPETAIEVMPDLATQINKEIEDKSQYVQTKNFRQPSFIRVDTERLQHLNYLAGELLIYQKRRSLQDEQVQEIIEQLIRQITRHQITLNELRDLPLQIPNIASQQTQNFAVKFDSLEMDVYTEFHMTLHEAIEETLQLQETTESLELLVTQAAQISNKQENLTLNIIESLVEARMLPLGNILNRFPHMVNKFGNVYDKLVELKLTGTEVLVDKAIAEKLYDPLLHLVRNAFDHGIEAPQLRRELGKPEQGLIEIRAYHQGSQTVIEVRDDGQGLNLERIRRKAAEFYPIQTEEKSNSYASNLAEPELLDMIFSPGFSTANKVTEISGRGMGLDIVRTQMNALNGSISVQSLPNQGTIFMLKIPFSMTTEKLMLVQAKGVIYALLLDSIEKILIPSEQQIKEIEGQKVLHWNTDNDETMVSLRQLSKLINYNDSSLNSPASYNTSNTDDPSIAKNPVLLLRRNQGMFALEVDQIIGEQELVIRPLGNAIVQPKYIYGCSSLPNGNLILVIDASLLLESNRLQQTTLDIMARPIASPSNKKALAISGDTFASTPLLPASISTTTIETEPSYSHESENKLPKVVLVVDDAISLRQTISLTLQKSGYQVIQAQNGVEALEKLQLHPEIQVVVSDLEMPRMNGFELLGNFRQYPKLAKIPVVILTSRSAEKHRQLAQELGAKAYLTKPYLENEFLSTIKGLMNSNADDLNHLLMVTNH
ncbi:hybrid sensor histidine kinase/response regulator [Nostoc sp. 'Peltigera membranacea cyanobiont' 213]|uniref:hybrid sensor histidine kinase/response regulator n=2 Tax=unclassified Nostoc TaxID=2593658 RepID=UPI000B95AE73|nr:MULTISPECIES: hybrid sensor histidine kinase/response regulator [unclassified Nostoc]AVH65081.1 chemotaxis protein histidine kinase CheA [Nostoc sp. 'Peltigera membranacea cyanobiont' N6]OYD94219.1 hybrid sensor histidine kinase/response regulator [Nostoc sp. 'Peltigera membranacea cyanobiont' 213]